MTIAFRSVATIASASSGSVTAPTPASTVDGDIIVIWTLQKHSSSNSSNSASLSGGSSGIFTQILGYNTGITGSGQHQFAAWIGRRGASYTAPSVDYTTGGLGNFVNSIAFSDDDPVPSGDFWEDLTQGGPSTTSPYGGTVIDTTAVDRMVIQLGAILDNNSYGAISGGTGGSWAGDMQQSSTGTDGTLTVEYEPFSTAQTVTGPTRTSSTDEWHSFMFAIFGDSAATQDITGALFTNSNTFYQSTVSVGAVNIAGELFDNRPNTFYQASISVGEAQDITGALYTNTQTFYESLISHILNGTLFTNSNTFYDATVGRGAVDIDGELFTNSNTFYGATVSSGGAIIEGELVVNDNTFYEATIGRGTMNITASLFDDSVDTFYSATIAGPITGALFTNMNTFYSADIDIEGVRRNATVLYLAKGAGVVSDI